MLTLRTNVSSLDAQRSLYENNTSLSTSLQRLSSGYRINSAADDAAGLGISTKLEAQIRSFSQAARNANDALSVIQTAQGSLNQATAILTRMRELAMESASDGVGNTERGYIQAEQAQLASELTRLQATAKFNGVTLFGGASLNFQVDVGSSSNDYITVDTSSMNISASSLGVSATWSGTVGGGSIVLSTSATISQGALGTIDSAITTIASYQATLGAYGNRISNVIANIQTFVVNLSSANSRIKDVDVASETSNLTRMEILQQAAVSVLAQANQQPQLALKLITG